ncbi:hypothetical protein GCM10010193_40280 [Kitasatospora atroaurantiaca]|uniref:Condensation domain-containing protein n=1 Tax=Kitasatospora atroaurantiaca TaxID=285545 RepID=A0A561EKR2_9ACTN|nr:condensation domain-containing protein [Kitasatospora atroaurantiaca]TWE16213.1 condensation domain-containing protein [Kitasatospora atroaurantiaca]
MTTDDSMAPLTFGQLSVWRVLQTYPLDRWSETYIVAALPTPPLSSFDKVEEAVNRLSERHESLRTNFVDTASGPRQVVRPHRRVHVQSIEKPGATSAEALEIAWQLAARRFDWESEFGFRFAVLTDRGKPTHVLIVLDHIVADGFGFRRLRAELSAMLGADNSEGVHWLADQPPQPTALALAQRSDGWRRKRKAVTGYWQGMLDALPATTFPFEPPAEDVPGRVEAALHSPGARVALGITAGRVKVSPQSVLLALSALAISTATSETQVVLTLQSSNRFDRQWRGVVSSMNQFVPLVLETGPADLSFAEFAARVQWAGLTAYRHGSYDFDEITDLVRQQRGRELDFDHFFNFTAYDVNPVSADLAGPFIPGRIERTSNYRQIGPRLNIKVHSAPDMPIIIRSDTKLIPEPKLHSMLTWYDEELHRLAGGAEGKLGDILARCSNLLEQP